MKMNCVTHWSGLRKKKVIPRRINHKSFKAEESFEKAG